MSKEKYELEKKARLNSENVCYLSVRNLFLLSCYLEARIKVKIYRAMTSPVVLDGCETWFVTLRNGLRFILFEIR